MIHTMKYLFLNALVWLLTLNPDWIVKGFAVAASIATIIASYTTWKKNRKQ